MLHPSRVKVWALSEGTFGRIEARMRPGVISQSGFISDSDSLKDVVAADMSFLKSVGLAPEHIAARLQKIVDSHGELIPDELRPNSRTSGVSAEQTNRSESVETLPGIDRFTILPNTADIDSSEEDDIVRSFLAPRLVEGIYRRIRHQYNGVQECPFEDDAGIFCCECRSVDYEITKLSSQETLTVSALTIHLIRDHHFFEGNVRYRIDPKTVIRILEV